MLQKQDNISRDGRRMERLVLQVVTKMNSIVSAESFIPSQSRNDIIISSTSSKLIHDKDASGINQLVAYIGNLIMETRARFVDGSRHF